MVFFSPKRSENCQQYGSHMQVLYTKYIVLFCSGGITQSMPSVCEYSDGALLISLTEIGVT